MGITSLWEDLEAKVKWNFVKNGNLLLLGLQLENEERYIGMGPTGEMMFTFCQQMPFDKKWLRGLFYRVLPARSWEMPVERELPAKIGRYSKKLHGRNFDF